MKRLNLAALLLALYTLSFITIEYLGLFSEHRSLLRGILMFWIVLMLLLGIMVLLVFSALLNRNRMQRRHWLGLISVLLIVSGMWISRFTDFAIDVVLTEGQVYQTQGHRSEGLLYAGLFSPVPKFRLELGKVDISEGQPQAAGPGVKAEFIFYTPNRADPTRVAVSQGLPQFEKGMFLRVKNFGYSPRYVIKKSGQVLDSAFIFMRLYPFGSEDYFRLLSPHTFSLQYHPGHLEGGTERPLKLKITRNKDIVYDGYTGLKEDVEFEDASISFEEMRRWVQISISRDWGMLIVWTGICLAFVTAVLWVLKRYRRTT